MVSTSDTSEGPLERQRGKHRKFRGTTTVLTSILKIGPSRGKSDKMTVTSSPSVSHSGMRSSGRRSGVGSRRTSKNYNAYPSSSSSSTCNVFHPRIPPFPGTYLTTMSTPLPAAPLHPIPSSSSTHISLGHHASATALHMNSMLVPPDQTYYMPSHSYLQHMSLSNQPSVPYSMGPPLPPLPHQANIEAYMYMKAYLRDPWSNDGFRLMILLPVGPREDGTYGILNAGVKPEQVYSLCFYYADNILYYSLPDESSMYYIPA